MRREVHPPPQGPLLLHSCLWGAALRETADSMSGDTPTPLATPRSPGQPDEIKYVRNQARAWYAMRQLGDDPFHVLLPACHFCSSGDLTEIRYDCSAVCNDCGARLSMLEPFLAGRIAAR